MSLFLSDKNEKLLKRFVELNYEDLTDEKISPKLENWLLHQNDKKEDIFTEIKHLLEALNKNQYSKVNEKKLGKHLTTESENYKYELFKKKVTATKVRTEDNYIRAILDMFGDTYLSHKALIVRLMKEKFYISSEKNLMKKFDEIKEVIRIEKFENKVISGKKKTTLKIDFLDSMSGEEFELFLKEVYEKRGFSVLTTKKSGDQGADLILKKFGEKICVQAKRYSSSVGNDAIQEVVGALKFYNADKGMVITTNYFTSSATKLAKVNNVELIDRDGVKLFLKDL